jgi:hypothetical protein
MHPTQRLFALLPLLVLARSAAANEVTFGASRDNVMYAESGSESNGAGSHVHVGTNGQSQIRRGLMRFDVAANVPAGSIVTGVEMTLSMSMSNSGPHDVRLHRALADWGEGTSNAGNGEGSGTFATTNDATWTRRFHPSIFWTTPGGDFEPVFSATKSIDQPGFYTWTSPGLVADVQSMLDTPSANFGWVLVNWNEADTPTAKRFDSRQNSNVLLRPALKVIFDLPCTGSATSYCVAAPNSTGLGALIGTSGSLSVAANSFGLTCTQLPPSSPHLYFFGSQQTQSVFGNGYRCVNGTVYRLNPAMSATPAGTSSRAVDLASQPAAGVITGGSTWNFQCWYRNVLAGGAGFNLSDGIRVTFCN